MHFNFRSTRAIALATSGVLASTAFMTATPAHADKSKTLKYGAIGLGALGAYWLSKGETVEGAAAVAGGYYAYKKGRDEQRDDRYSNYPGDDWYTRDNRNRDYDYNRGVRDGGGYRGYNSNNWNDGSRNRGRYTGYNGDYQGWRVYGGYQGNYYGRETTVGNGCESPNYRDGNRSRR